MEQLLLPSRKKGIFEKKIALDTPECREACCGGPPAGGCCSAATTWSCDDSAPCINCGTDYQVDWNISFSYSWYTDPNPFVDARQVTQFNTNGRVTYRCVPSGQSHAVDFTPGSTFGLVNANQTAHSEFLPGAGGDGSVFRLQGTLQTEDIQHPVLQDIIAMLSCPVSPRYTLVNLLQRVGRELEQNTVFDPPSTYMPFYWPPGSGAGPFGAGFSTDPPYEGYPPGQEIGHHRPFGEVYPHDRPSSPTYLHCSHLLQAAGVHWTVVGRGESPFVYDPTVEIDPGKKIFYVWVKPDSTFIPVTPEEGMPGHILVSIHASIQVTPIVPCEPSPCEESRPVGIFELLRTALEVARGM